MTLIVVPRKPSAAGVSFSGGEYFELPSRKKVEREVDVFIHSAEAAEGATCAFVLGEWGEGKTELYNGRIAPSLRDRAGSALLPATTLANSYDLPSVRRLLETASVEAERFLVVLFAATGADDGNAKLGIPDPTKFQSAKAFLESSLKKLLPRPGGGRGFFFIDEFEDLLNRPDPLIRIISGLKELINGNYGPLGKGGEYSGALHFFISCTPNAYLRLPKERSIDQISGGFFRRTRTITLPSPPRGELVQFIQRLLQWCWEGQLPDPPPFKSAGVHEAIAYVTRGNLGACVSLVSWVLSNAESAKIEQVDGPFLVRALQGFRLTIYGAPTPSLEPRFYAELERAVRDPEKPGRTQTSLALVSQLAGEHQPQSTEELRVTNPALGNARDVRSSIDEVNRRLISQLGLAQSILAVKPLLRETDFSLLREYILNATLEGTVVPDQLEGNALQIDSYKENLGELEDRLVHFSIGYDGSVLPALYFPADVDSAVAFFEGITQKTAITLVHALEKHQQPRAEAYYVLSDQLKAQLFPSPVPPGLDFVIEQKSRLDIWREAGRDLGTLTESMFPGILPTLIDFQGEWRCEAKQGSGRKSMVYGDLIKEGTNIRVAFTGVASDPGKADVAEALESIKRVDSPAHLAVLLYSGEFDQQGTLALDKSGLGPAAAYRVLPLQLNAGLIRRIVAIGLCLRRPATVTIDNNALKATLTELLTVELDLLPQVESWLSLQAKAGLVVSPLQDREGNLQGMTRALRYFVNYPSEVLTAPAAWAKNQSELMALQFFGTKSSIVPDIGPEQLDRIAGDLLSNGFLSEADVGYSPILHPVERRILEVTKGPTGVQVDRLRSQFVDRTGTKAVEVVFLEALIDKGMIEKSKGRMISTVDVADLARALIQRFNSTAEGVRADAEPFERYGLLLNRKERGERWIDNQRWNALLVALATALSKVAPQPDWQDSSRTRLFGELLDTYESTFTRLVREAARSSQIEIQSLRRTLVETRRSVRSAVGENLGPHLGVDLQSLVELSTAEERIRSLEELDKTPAMDVDRKRVKTEVGVDHFSFDSSEEDADYFNPKLALLKKGSEEVRGDLKSIESRVGEIGHQLDLVRQDEADVRLRARSLNPPASAECSKHIRSILVAGLPPISPKGGPKEPAQSITLEELLRRVEQFEEEQSSQVHLMGRCVNSLKDLAKIEPDARENLGKFTLEWQATRQQIAAGLPARGCEDIDAKLEAARQEVQKLGPRSEQLIVNASLEKTRDFTEECVTFFSTLQRDLTRWRSDIRASWSGWEASVRERVSSLRDLVGLLPKGGPRSTIESNLSGVVQRLDSRHDEPDFTLLRDVNKILSDSRANLYALIAKSFGGIGDLPRAMETVTRATANGASVSYDALLLELQRDLGADAKTARSQLDRLIQAGFLQLLVRRRDS
jgi:hypothetical protein